MSCRKPAPRVNNDFSYRAQVGVAVTKSGKTCLEIHNPSLAAGSRLRLVNLSIPQSFSEARILGRADETCPGIDAGDVDSYRYEIRLIDANPESSTPAIGIHGYAGPFTQAGGQVAADLDGDGQPEFFRSCTSSEGVHFTVWSAKPLAGKLRWHQYYYLGYDVEADCTSMDVQTSPH